MPPQHPLPDHASSSSDSVYDDGDLDTEELLQLSSSDSSAGPSPVIPKLTLSDSGGDGADDISKDLAELEELRKSVQNNLRLRPIRSRGRLPKLDGEENGIKMPGAFPMSAKLKEEFDIQSPTAPGTGPAILTAAVPALTTTVGHTTGQQGTSLTALTAGMAGAVDSMNLHTAGDSSTAAHSITSTDTTPTRLKPRPKSKSKAPPPALILQNPTTVPTHLPQDIQATAECEIIVPPHQPFAKFTSSPGPGSLSLNVDTPVSATSPTSSILSSYFTPVGDTPITSRFVGPYYASPLPTINSEMETEGSGATSAPSTPTEQSSSNVISFDTSPTTTLGPQSNSRAQQASDKPQPVSATDLYSRLFNGLAGQPQPLVIDTRAPAAHVAYRIRGSVNIAIPSLILKRCRKMTASGILRIGTSESGPNPSASIGGPQTGGGKGGFQNMEALRQFIVGEKAKDEWTLMLNSLHRDEDTTKAGELVWDGDVIVYDEEMEQDFAGTAWTLMEVLTLLVARHGGRVDYLEGGIVKGVKDTKLEKMIEFGPMRSNNDEEPTVMPGKKSTAGGLFQLDTKRKLSDIEASSELSASAPLSSNPTSPYPLSIPRSPLSIIPPLASANIANHTSVPDTLDDTLRIASSIPVHVISDASHAIDSAPSPPPSSIVFRHHPTPSGSATAGGLKSKRPSAPNLRRIDTKSAERLNPNLPKLSVRTKPTRSATLTIPPRLTLPNSSSLHPPASPSHLNLVYSSHTPPTSARYNGGFGVGDGGNGSFGLTPYYTPPHTPGTPKAFSSLQGPTSAYPGSYGGSHSQFFGYGPGSVAGSSSGMVSMERDRTLPPSPSTARPDPPSTESEAIPTFTISTILPNFLFLGPELTEPAHVEELKELGVKRILNIAAECNEDDHGLNLKERFQRYVKIPMRDTVEEENILKGIREACEMLDDARLHSAPTYVHCKAGKSRSVTAVMAYLIHANHWMLSKAYGFVLERRKGISPNIGFVSELMNFEEQELGGKSIGVQSTTMGGESGEGGNAQGEEIGFSGMGLRRGGHVRESLPPLESFSTAAAAVVNGDRGGDKNGTGGSLLGMGGPMSAGERQLQRVLVGDQAQETEVKDASGRYRHARRAPVDEATLQPSRRVSKAGLESSVFEELPKGEREREKEREKEVSGRWI